LVSKVRKLIDNWKELKGNVEKLTNLNAKLIKKRGSPFGHRRVSHKRPKRIDEYTPNCFFAPC